MAKKIRVYLRNGRSILADEPRYKNGHVYVDVHKADFFVFKDREWTFGTWIYKIEWQGTKQTDIMTERELDDRVQLGFAKLYHRPRAGKGRSKTPKNNLFEGELFTL